MAQQTYDAIFENGVFRPLSHLSEELAEGQHVRLVVETETPENVLDLATQVYEGLSDDEIDEIEQIALDRRKFFEKNV